MSIIVTLQPGSKGYAEHQYDYIARSVKLSQMNFARRVYEQTGFHIDLSNEHRYIRRKGEDSFYKSGYPIMNDDGEYTGYELYLDHSPAYYMHGKIYVRIDIGATYTLEKERKNA